MSEPINSSSKEKHATNFRQIFRDVLANVLEQSIATGDIKISLDEIPGLLEQVRETADSKFGDFTATLAMPLAKRLGVKPRGLATDLISRINQQQLFEKNFDNDNHYHYLIRY